MKILVVDDSSFKRKSLAYIIERQGHEVLEAVDGVEGIEKTRTYMPDIIISDLLMPRMDGFQFLRNIKRDEQLRAIPFIVYSVTYKEEKERSLALSLGAIGFIEEMDKPEIFWQKLQEIIESERFKEGETCKPLIEEDEEFLKHYSHIVAAKLEDKVIELEKSIAERKKAEEKIMKLSLAIEQTPVSMFITDAVGNIEYVNPKFTETTGYGQEEVIGKKPDILISGTAAISDTGWRGEFLARKKNGETFWEYSTISPIVNDKGDITNFVGISEDITKRKQAEESLRESERKYRRLVENLKDRYFFYSHDTDGVFSYLSPSITNILGYTQEEFLTHYTEYLTDNPVNKDVVTHTDLSIKGISQPPYHVEIYNKNRSIRWLEVMEVPMFDKEGKVVAVEGIACDITERKKAEEERRKAEEQVRQLQKMEAIGQLAGGIAHDFNNVLTAIIGFSTLLLMKSGKDSLIKEYAEKIIAASKSAASMVQSILSFSRLQAISLKPVDINELVKNFQKTLMRLIREDIELQTVLKGAPLIVMADHTQIEQVLMNLATNARDAMPHGGIIKISSEIMKIDDRFVKAHGYGITGLYAMLFFTDTGTGMDEETKRKIFEPFFTTKEVGKGTGLGLAMVYGIIKQHNGFITVYSEPGKGTTFRISLPLVESAVDTKKVQENDILIGGSETILLVEDNENVRNLITTVLESSGYNLIVAVNGDDAVNKFRENKDAIKLCISDMVMPKKGGREAYEEMKKIRADINVLFMSGYTADDEMKGFLKNGLDFISKPVSPSDLLKKVREMIDRCK